MNYFNQLLSNSKNPYLRFSESLPGIPRILTVDSPNGYRRWVNFNIHPSPQALVGSSSIEPAVEA